MTQDLTPNGLPEKPISPVLSPGLNLLLRDEAESARWEILDDAELKAEAIAQVPVLRAAATQRAGVHGVQQVIGKRFALYPQPDRSEGEWGAWWADYYEALADLPWAALEAGMAAYVRDPASEFMPKPGKLRELALKTENWQTRAYTRAKWVADYTAPKVYEPRAAPIDPPPVRTVEEATAIKRMAQETLKALGAAAERTRPPQGDLPSIAGKPDAGGLTKEMRELMARRAEG